MNNWKTSITGLAVIAGGVYLIAIKGQNEMGGMLIVAGLGLLGAKDHNATV